MEYDPKTRQYYIVEKIGNRYYRTPTYLTYEEFQRLQARKAENDYFRKRADMLSGLNRKNIRPKLQWHNNLVNRIFGSGPDGLPKVRSVRREMSTSLPVTRDRILRILHFLKEPGKTVGLISI